MPPCQYCCDRLWLWSLNDHTVPTTLLLDFLVKSLPTMMTAMITARLYILWPILLQWPCPLTYPRRSDHTALLWQMAAFLSQSQSLVPIMEWSCCNSQHLGFCIQSCIKVLSQSKSGIQSLRLTNGSTHGREATVFSLYSWEVSACSRHCMDYTSSGLSHQNQRSIALAALLTHITFSRTPFALLPTIDLWVLCL